jgi:EsV-1-7 cysteine-rich motif
VKRSSYGFTDVGTSVRCSRHKVVGMVNFSPTVCEIPSCNISASFGHEGDRKWKRCKEHKVDGMINLVNKICKHPTCNRQASYGYKADKQLVRCKKHIEENMVLLTCQKCEHPTCNTRASFGEPGTNASNITIAYNLKAFAFVVYLHELPL